MRLPLLSVADTALGTVVPPPGRAHGPGDGRRIDTGDGVADTGCRIGWHTGWVPDALKELTVGKASDWSRWLREHGTVSLGVWLVLAKKGTTEPTTLTYDEALEEAICNGWIDGQLARRDEGTFRRKFTPRRRGSAWSKRNVALAIKLTDEGRMKPAGLDAVERAKADGSWDVAYGGQSSSSVPTDLAASLAANPAAQAMFDRLDATNRYSVIYRVSTAKRSDTRRRRIEQFVTMLARGETIHPQRKRRVPAASPTHCPQ
jgi:uncharacterized protein YdeI (YjbR/CyaY-like superfamily)